MKTEKIYLYENRKDVYLTSYLLSGADPLLAGKRRPAIIICPGGAYMKCATQESEPVAMRFAAMGYHAFVLKYSTYFEGVLGEKFPETEEEITRKENTLYPAQIEELGQAMLLLRDHGAVWNIDVDRIGICGFSAGAHNAAMYATTWNNGMLTEKFGRPSEDFRPAVLIASYMISDYHLIQPPYIGKEKEFMFQIMNMAIAGECELTKEQIELLSPARHVTKDMPPTFLWATANDGTVPVENTLQMGMALTKEQIPYEMHIFENGIHGLSLADQSSAKNTQLMNRDAAKWVPLVEAWLMKRFALPIE